MAITTIYSIAKRANILSQYIDEDLGAGTGSKADFDLLHDNVLATTLTLSTTTPGTNVFTDLTDVTHYAADLPSGRVVLTAAGMTLLGTKELYGNYYGLAKLSAAQLTQFLGVAEKRLRYLTGRVWEAASFTDYLDGRARSGYPSTDRPFMEDRDEYDSISLSHWPVQSVSEVYFLDRTLSAWAAVQSADAAVYTDNTEEANAPGGTAFYIFAVVPAANDAIYFGLGEKFLGVVTNLQTLGTDAGSLAVTWEYYNGSTWASLSGVTAGTTGSNLFTASGKVSWTLPSAWAETTINGSNNLYYVRARLSAGSYTASPKLWEAWPDPDSVLKDEISVRAVDVRSDGRLTFLDDEVPDGVRNLRVKYIAGVAASDEIYALGVDLADAIGALMCAVAITGGSFDDETHFQLGDSSVTIGEVYVNVAEVVKQLKTEIDGLCSLIGKNYELA